MKTKKIPARTQDSAIQVLKDRIVDLKKSEAELKRLGALLKDSEEKFKIIFEDAPDAIYLNDARGNFVDGNRAAEELIGYEKGELVGKSILREKILAPGQLTKVASILKKTAQGRATGPDELVLLRKDGRPAPVEIRTFPVRIKRKKVILGIARDISARVEAEETIRQKERLYRALFENANDAVFLLNLEGIHVDVNQKAADMLGYSREELIGMSLQDTVVKRELSAARDRLAGLIEGKEYPLFERIQVRKDGTEFPVEINISLIRDPEGKPLLIQSIVRDITERKKNEDKITRSLQEKEILLKEIHHRVKNNMQIISSLLRLKASDPSGKGVKAIFQESQDQIRSMALVHEQLYESKDLSRIDFGHYIQKLVDNLRSSYEGMAAVEIVLELESIELDVTRAIPCGLILNELVTNAYEHAFPEGRGRLIVGLNRMPDGKIHMEVRDNGIGISDGLDLNTLSSLGLTLVRDLTLQLEGRLDVSSTGGSRFEVTFP